jgi:uncharacterized protein YjgD (DUF1641 family)
VNNALYFFQKLDVVVDEKISYWQLMKEINDPEMKRGLAFLIRFMKNMVQTNGNSKFTDEQNTNKKQLKED